MLIRRPKTSQQQCLVSAFSSLFFRRDNFLVEGFHSHQAKSCHLLDPLYRAISEEDSTYKTLITQWHVVT